MRMQKINLAVCVLGACLATSFVITALRHRIGSAKYSIIDIGTLPGLTGSNYYAKAINNKGEIIGEIWAPNNGPRDLFYYHEGSIRKFPAISGYKWCQAVTINDGGTILAYATNPDHDAVAPLTGNSEKLSLYKPPSFIYSMMFCGINKEGLITGYYFSDNGVRKDVCTAFVMNNRTPRPIAISSGTSSAAYGINSSGQAVGFIGSTGNKSQPFIYADGKTTLLPNLPGYQSGWATAINDRGDITGYSEGAGEADRRAFLFHKGSVINLGTLPGFSGSGGIAINRDGVVVGAVRNHRGDEHAAIFKDGVVTDLNTLIGAGSPWELNTAYGINDHGEIVGYGHHDGAVRAFLLTPKD